MSDYIVGYHLIKYLVNGAQIIAKATPINKGTKKIPRIIPIVVHAQKLRQKSQLNNSDITFGALSIILSLNPILPISKIRKEDTPIITKAYNPISKIIDVNMSINIRHCF